MTQTGSTDGSRLRVVIVSPYGTVGPGGISRFSAYAEREMTRRDDVTVAVHRTILVRVPVLRSIAEGYSLLHFAWRCRRDAVDVVHLNVAAGNSTWRKHRFLRAARLCGCAVVVHLHGSAYDTWYDGLGARRARHVRRFVAAADHVIVCGRYWSDVVTTRLGVDAGRVTVVCNGVPDPRRTATPTASPTRLVTLGTVGERKGTDVLLAALARLPDHLDWTCDIAGTGELARFTAERDRLGLTDRVRVVGWWPEDVARDALLASDVFVLPSRGENQPVAIVEAMAAGLPVLSTTIAAIPEVVEHDVTGVLVPPGDVDALAAALQRLIGSPDERARMGRAGRRRYEDSLTIEHCIDRVLAVHRDAAAGPRSG